MTFEPEKMEKVRVYKFNGSYYNYKKMIGRLYPGKEPSEVSNCLNEDGSASMYWQDEKGYWHKPKFTGVVIFHDSRMILKKGDYYMVKV